MTRTMRIAVLEPGFPPAALQPAFGTYGDMVAAMLGPDFEVEKVDATTADLPLAGDHDGYVVTGSAAGVYDDFAWIPRLKAWLQQTSGAAPMIGICFGHQIMAEAFGGGAEKSSRGWGVGLHTYTLNTTTAWMDQPAATVSLPVSHQDQVTALGPGAALIGGSDFCPFGIIAYPDRKALSLQPHPEWDPAYARALFESRSAGPLSKDQADAAVAALQAPNDNAKVGGWLRRFLREEITR